MSCLKSKQLLNANCFSKITVFWRSNKTDRLSFLVFNNSKLIPCSWSEISSFIKAARFDKQAICEELKMRLTKWNYRNPCFASLVVRITAAISFIASSSSQISMNSHNVLISYLKKYSQIYRLIFIKTAPICSLLLKNQPANASNLCHTYKNARAGEKKKSCCFKAAVLSLKFKLIGIMLFWH